MTEPIITRGEPIITRNEDGSTTVFSLNNRDTAAEAIASIANATERFVRDFMSAADLSTHLPADIREVISGASSDITRTLGRVDVATASAASHRANDTMFPAGRERLANEEINKAGSDVTESLDAAEAKIDVAEALLSVAARPTMPKGADVSARADARMVLDGASDAGQLADRIKELAQRGDALGALVADDSWLTLYLTSRGTDSALAKSIKIQVGDQVFRAAAASDDPKRAAAGRTALALTHLRKAVVAARSYRRNKLK